MTDKIFKTIQDVIDYKSPYDLRDYTFFKDSNGFVMYQDDLFNKYFPIIESYVETVAMPLDLRTRYKYKPDKLSIDLYKTDRLDWMLMRLNGIPSPSRFILSNRIKFISPDKIVEVFDIIRTKNTQEISANHAAYDIY